MSDCWPVSKRPIVKSTGSPGSVFRLYRIQGGTQTLIWTGSIPIPSYPLALAQAIYYQNDSITNTSITGAPIVTLTGGNTELSLLPFDRGTRLTKPVVVSPDGQSATIISGDTSVDAAYTTGSFASSSSGGTIPLRLPSRGTFQAGDIVDLIDFPAGRACLYRVDQVNSTTGAATLAVRPVDSSQPAWGRLSSDLTDSQYTFPAGAAVVKLAQPVSYYITNDRRLVRMEGNRVTTAAFNVRSLALAETATSGGWSYTISLTLAAEGVETDSAQSTETRATIEYTSTPRALNLQANQLN